MSKYGEPWPPGEEAWEGDGAPGININTTGPQVFVTDWDWKQNKPTQQQQEYADRVIECVNALAGLNPAGIRTLIREVERVVEALEQHAAPYPTDATNILPTLKTALAAVKGPE